MRSMRALRFVSLAVGLILVLYAYFALMHPRSKAADHPFFEGERTLVIAHQGGRGLWPENTLLAFQRSLDLGVDVLEMDLRGTSDGQIVVQHDGSVERTTEGSGLVRELTLDELRRLDAGYRFAADTGGVVSHPYRGRGLVVPTLIEVLSRFPASRLNLEMKEFDAGLARSLCSVLRERRCTERALVASFEHEPMLAFRDACPEVATSATLREGLAFYQLDRLGLGSLYRSPAVAFQVPEYFGDIQVIRPRFLEVARSFNVRVQVWTVNEEDDLSRMLAMGVDGIVTDYPDRLLRLMGRLARKP
jgi:glycerophosphoryl diester phosphodiesterase